MTPFGYLDAIAIIFSFIAIGFITEPYDVYDELYICVIVIGFLMWGMHAIRRPWNLPVRFPTHIPRGFLIFGAVTWIATGVGLVLLIMVGERFEILSLAAILVSFRTFSIYALTLKRKLSQNNIAVDGAH